MFQAVKTAAVGVCAAIAFCVPAPALAAGPDLTTWLFAEGSTNGAFGFEQEILIGNPNTTPITVTFELFTQDGEALAPVVRTLEPLSRYGENIRGLVGDRAGIAIRLTVERADHCRTHDVLGRRVVPWRQGLEPEGQRPARRPQRARQPAAAKTWYFAEGEGKFFNTFISVANPNDTPATVTASYRDDAGVEVTQTDVVPGQRPTDVLADGGALRAPPAGPRRLCHHRHLRSRRGRRAADVLGAGRAVRHPRRPCGGGRDHAVGARGCLPRASRARSLARATRPSTRSCCSSTRTRRRST